MWKMQGKAGKIKDGQLLAGRTRGFMSDDVMNPRLLSANTDDDDASIEQSPIILPCIVGGTPCLARPHTFP